MTDRHGTTDAMEGFGERLRARARQLGLSDSEVARRLGMQQTRYSNYVSDLREPDLATLIEICRVLGVTPDVLLGVKAGSRAPREVARLRERIEASAASMPPEQLRIAAELMDTLAAYGSGDTTRRARKARRRPRQD